MMAWWVNFINFKVILRLDENFGRSNSSFMPCLVALNWPQNWIFGIGNPNSVVWLYSELERGIENQFRAPPPAWATYRFVNSEVESSVFVRNWLASLPFSLPKERSSEYELFSHPGWRSRPRRRRQVPPPPALSPSLPTPPLPPFRPCRPPSSP